MTLYEYAEEVHDQIQYAENDAKEKVEYAPYHLSEDLRKVINNPEYSDVVFLCKDGRKVHASRLFLVAQSKVLHRMLLNGMVESRLSEITLHEISSTELLAVMEYLYTGVLRDHAPVDWEQALLIMIAAAFFSLDRLLLIVQPYLLKAANELGSDTEAVVKHLSIGVKYLHLPDDAVDLAARHLVRILMFKSLQPQHLQALSAEALTFYLEAATAVEDEDPDILTTTEFMRFKTVILWCTCQQFAAGEPLAPETMPPKILLMVELLNKSPFNRDAMTCDQSKKYSNMKDALAVSVKKYLPFVNFRHIPPQFIVHIIEPLDIVPACDLMDALRSHALRTTFETEENIQGWHVDWPVFNLYHGSRRHAWIRQVAPGNAFAVYQLSMNRYVTSGDGRYEWQITINEVCDGFVEIGMHFGDAEISQGNLSSNPKAGPYAWMSMAYFSIDTAMVHLAVSRSSIGTANIVGNSCTARIMHTRTA